MGPLFGGLWVHMAVSAPYLRPPAGLEAYDLVCDDQVSEAQVTLVTVKEWK